MFSFLIAVSCTWYECPKGEIFFPEEDGVVFKNLEPKDCLLKGSGTKEQSEKFIKDNVGKYSVIDCRKNKKEKK